MWMQRAVTLCGCLAALPLMGCANGLGGPPQAHAPAVPGSEAARVYAVGPGQRAAILVMLPGPSGRLGADWLRWAAPGFRVVSPSPTQLYQIVADQQAAAAAMIAQSQAIADAPFWLAGASPAVEATPASMPPTAPGQVSGVVVTSMTSGAGTCSERMIYSYPASGGAPKVTISKAGNACPAGSPLGVGANATIAPQAPVRAHAPRLIEASASTAGGLASAPASGTRKVADLIKGMPPS